MQWKVTQTGQQHAAALTELQLKISQQTLKLIKKTNKLMSDVKLNETHVSIHSFSRHLKWNDLALIGYTDGAKGDRSDGGSTGGYVLTMDPNRPLQSSLALLRRICPHRGLFVPSPRLPPFHCHCNLRDVLYLSRMKNSTCQPFEVVGQTTTATLASDATIQEPLGVESRH